MSTNELVLRAEQIFKSYRMGATRLEVLKGASFSVRSGEFLAIVGASGSGKSTLLHILGALDGADGGFVEFRGSRLDKLSNRQLNRFRNKHIGFVFQFYHLLDELNVLENVTLPVMAGVSVLGWLQRAGQAKRRARELLGKLGLAERLRHKPYQLSGGERQRVAIARALANQPELLLADEPTGNLDSVAGQVILDIFGDLNQSGQTIIMVTHDSRMASRAHRVVTLADGKIV
jgi:ABC-type lipoprotein export system ATPase subunit